MTETVATRGGIGALIAVPLLMVGLLVGAYLFWQWGRRNDWADSLDLVLPRAGLITCLVGTMGACLGLWWGMHPWKAEYHQWRPVSGTVATVDSRLVGSGKAAMEDNFVSWTNNR